MQSLAGIKVIIAEDEELLRGILRDEFEYHGAIVYEAENGQIAFDLNQMHRPDVIVSDVRMPGGDGLEFLERLMKEKTMPLFYFSTAFTDINQNEAIRLGARRLFSKPYDLKTLIDAIVEDVKK